MAVINESFARARFPHQDSIGKKVKLAWGPWMTVVGVVGDVRQSGLDQAPEQAVYAAQTQGLWMGYYRLVARTRADPMRLEHDVRDAFLSVDKLQAVYHVKPLDRYLAGTLADRTFATGLLALFGALALALAAVGIYGIASYAVSLRTREIGIRMALGAQHSEVLTGVLRDVLVLVVGGIAIGYAASVVVGRLLAKLLFEVRPTDMATAAAVAVVLGGTALVAGGFPAKRAASIDPVVALQAYSSPPFRLVSYAPQPHLLPDELDRAPTEDTRHSSVIANRDVGDPSSVGCAIPVRPSPASSRILRVDIYKALRG